jgi:NADPH:quinone reductase
MDWEILAAVPEAFATAWSALHLNLKIEPRHRVLVRGATPAVGQAAVQVAATQGCSVLATTRVRGRSALLRELGAAEVLVDDGLLAVQLYRGTGTVDRVADLVGNRALLDSLRCVGRDGRVVQLGFLGGLEPLATFNPMLELPTGVQFSFYGSAFVLGTGAYPLSEVPLGAIFEAVACGKLRAGPVRVFAFDEVVEAHRAFEAGSAGGKMVVRVQ